MWNKHHFLLYQTNFWQSSKWRLNSIRKIVSYLRRNTSRCDINEWTNCGSIRREKNDAHWFDSCLLKPVCSFRQWFGANIKFTCSRNILPHYWICVFAWSDYSCLCSQNIIRFNQFFDTFVVLNHIYFTSISAVDLGNRNRQLIHVLCADHWIMYVLRI